MKRGVSRWWWLALVALSLIGFVTADEWGWLFVLIGIVLALLSAVPTIWRERQRRRSGNPAS